MPVFCLASSDIDKHWDRLSHHLVRFCEKTQEATVDQLWADLCVAKKQLWGYEDGQRITLVCLTEITSTTCWLWAGCGTESSPNQIEDGIAAIAAWAKAIGCTKLKLRGRKGWERRLKAFKRVGVILEKDL